MTKIITIAANKGGVAKSTTATTVAAKLALLSYPTLLADFGPQGSCSTLLGRDPEPGITNLFDRNEPLANVVRHIETVPALDLLPGNMDTRRSGNDKYKLDRSIQKTAQTFRDKLSGYQYTVIDTHPGDWYSELAICLADILVMLKVILASLCKGNIIPRSFSYTLFWAEAKQLSVKQRVIPSRRIYSPFDWDKVDIK